MYLIHFLKAGVLGILTAFVSDERIASQDHECENTDHNPMK